MAARVAPISRAPRPDYADPQEVRSSADAFGVDETDMMRYIGANWPRYRDLWQDMKGGPDLRVSFSFAAFFFSTFWLFYRKLYAMAFASIALVITAGFIASSLEWVVNLGVCVAAGLYGKALVVQRGITTVERIKAMDTSPEASALRIEKAGGTNWLAPGSLVLLFVAAVAIAVAGAALEEKGGAASQTKQTGAAVTRKS